MLENLDNITKAIEKGIITDNLLQRAEALEEERSQLETQLKSMQLFEPIEYNNYSYLFKEWKELKRNTEEFRSFVQQFVREIRVFPYHLEIVLDVGLGVVADLTETISLRRGELYEMFESRVRE